jgi:tannase
LGIYNRLFDSQRQRADVGWQIGSKISDATATWNNETNTWALSIPSTGGEYMTKFKQLLDLDNLLDLEGLTYDALVDWMNTGVIRYMHSL